MLVDLPELPILTIDLPGAGLSPAIEPVSIRAAGLAVAESLRALGVRRAVLGGISMGGHVAMSVMKDAPELLAGVVLMHTKAAPDDPEARAARLRTAHAVLEMGSAEVLAPMAAKMISPASQASQPGLVETVEHWIDQATPGGVAWAADAMAGRDDAMPILRASGLPATVIAGSEDQFASVAQAEAITDGIGPTANLVVAAGIGHLGPLETPNFMARVIRESYRRMLA
jgi:pimeloyl-ACP methyl ester carboxylesterase